MMSEDFLKVMWYEYCARDGFCLQLRIDLGWDKMAFERLTEAMRLCCKHFETTSAQQQKTWLEQAAETVAAGVGEAQMQVLEEIEDDLSPPPLTDTRMLPSWLAGMFWNLSHFVKNWTSHGAWDADRAREPEYFRKAYMRLDRLASWFFSGTCPWLDEEAGWASLH